MDNQHPRADAFAAIALLIIVVPFIAVLNEIYIDPFDPGFGARDFPIGVITAIVLLACVLLFRAVRQMRREKVSLVDPDELRPLLRYSGPVLLLGLGYIWLFVQVQYLVPTMLMLSLSLALFGNRGWVRLGVVPIVAGFCYYILFFVLLDLHEFPGALISYDGKSLLSF
ncbi:tripartite tricarboxylate transporter TctB family protein [Antarctobacter sp.]|uniref:tripartite tricarboxylate transporter TctB family protein n=1 Tax=Antarctobacter sp. TaxID=1872577 RepID=UPI003A90ED5C